MANEVLIFDATGSNVDGTDPGTALEVGPADDLLLREFSAPAPSQTVTYAGSVDTEGSVPASRKHENRVITCRILCKTAASLRQLQAKVGKVAREGGTLKWILPNAEVVIFDLLAADSFEPTIDKLMYVRSGTYVEAVIVLPAKPYGRGVEVDLGDNTTTTLPWLVFTDTGVKGDWYGLGRLVADNDEAATGVYWFGWGVQSRYYDSASTASLYYEAESCALFGGTTAAAGPAGASGGGNNVAKNTNLGTGTTSLLYIGTSSTAQTHIGDFRVFARVYVPAANAGIVSVGATWRPYVGAIEITNTPVQIVLDGAVALEDSWVMVDLGQVSLPKVAVGTQGWLGWIYAQSTSAGDDINVDWVALVPITESSGEISSLVSQTASATVRHDGVYVQDGTSAYWKKPQRFEGDYLLIPPAGAEARTLRTILRFAGHVPLSADRDPPVTIASADYLPDMSARLFYTPRYLVVPEP